MLDHLLESGVGAEKVPANVVAGLDHVLLKLAVDGGVHLVDEETVVVLGEQIVPLPRPYDLDHVPAGPPKRRLELLDYLAVAPHRSIEPLKVAVHHEDEVIEALPGRDGEGGHGLGLIHLSIAHECPHSLPGGVLDAPVLKVAVEAGLVDRVERRQAHGDRGELPILGHQTRVGIGGQPSAEGLPPEVVEAGLVEATLEEGAGIDARGRMSLEIDLVPAALGVGAVEEVVEADLVKGGGGGIGGDVSSDAVVLLVGTHHHGGRIPADDAPYRELGLLVAGEVGFLLSRDRIDVVGRHHGRQPDLAAAGMRHDLVHQITSAGGRGVDQLIERLDPFLGLVRVDVWKLAHVGVEHRGLPSSRGVRE